MIRDKSMWQLFANIEDIIIEECAFGRHSAGQTVVAHSE
jgi:hypothetical protein